MAFVVEARHADWQHGGDNDVSVDGRFSWSREWHVCVHPRLNVWVSAYFTDPGGAGGPYHSPNLLVERESYDDAMRRTDYADRLWTISDACAVRLLRADRGGVAQMLKCECSIVLAAPRRDECCDALQGEGT